MIIKRSFSQYINDIMNDKFKSMISEPDQQPKQTEAEHEPTEVENVPDDKGSKIVTTGDELEAYVIVKSMLHETVSPERIKYKDTQTYFNILLDGRVTRWICRVQLQSKSKFVLFPEVGEMKGEKLKINSNDDLFQYKDKLISIVQHYNGDHDKAQ